MTLPPTGNAWIDNARDQLRLFHQRRLDAEEAYQRAEADLHDAWMSSRGSDGYKRTRFTEDRRVIWNAEQIRREAEKRDREAEAAARAEIFRIAKKEDV
jgi:hypothetical protein